MSTTALSTRSPRGINPKVGRLQQLPRKIGFRLPEYLEMAEVNAFAAAAPKGQVDHARAMADQSPPRKPVLLGTRRYASSLNIKVAAMATKWWPM